MKYIFKVNAQNQQIKDIIDEKTDIKTKANLHSSSYTNSEMWILYDDKTNIINYFNSISKDRNHPYRFIIISTDNDKCLDVFVSILARIRGFVSLSMDITAKEGTITGYDLPGKKDSFDGLFVDNSFANPVVFRMNEVIEWQNYSKLITGKQNKAYNIGILSIFLIDEGDDDRSALQTAEIAGFQLKRYNISEDESFLGCKINDFIEGVKSLDIKPQLSTWLGSKDHTFNEAIKNYVDEYDRVSADEISGLEYGLHFVIINNTKNESVVLGINDFLNSIDINAKIMWNMMKNMTGISEDALIDESLSYDEEEGLFPATSNIDKLFYLPNILNMKPFQFNLCDGKCI